MNENAVDWILKQTIVNQKKTPYWYRGILTGYKEGNKENIRGFCPCGGEHTTSMHPTSPRQQSIMYITVTEHINLLRTVQLSPMTQFRALQDWFTEATSIGLSRVVTHSLLPSGCPTCRINPGQSFHNR